MAQRGYSRDGKKNHEQIVYGLLCTAQGCPVAVEVFDGNTGDPKTVADQITKLKHRFDLSHVIMVGDRGMITQTRIREELAPAAPSPSAYAKATTGKSDVGTPVHSFHSLLKDLATITRNTVVAAIAPDRPFSITTRPTEIQAKAFELLGISV